MRFARASTLLLITIVFSSLTFDTHLPANAGEQRKERRTGVSNLFVNADLPDHGGDGASWATAFGGRLGLVNALAAAETKIGNGTQIWVAAGEYAPAAANAPRTSAFTLPPSTTILGGFAGDERSADERNASANIVTLTGDLNDNDGEAWQTLFDNSWHVIRSADGTGESILDGVTLTARAEGSQETHDSSGAGILLINSSLTVRNCTFMNLFAQDRGAGIAIVGASATSNIDSCIFTHNEGNWGGGIAVTQNASPTITACTFTQNHGGFGGGIYTHESSSTVTDCLFLDNAIGPGGSSGAGIFDDHSSSFIDRCRFHHNHTVGGGGGVYLFSSTTILNACDFVDNAAPGDGGGAAFILGDGWIPKKTPPLPDSGPHFINCRFTGNNGAITAVGPGAVTLLNCTVANNGPGLAWWQSWPTLVSTQGALITLRNCLIHHNPPVIEPGLAGILFAMADGTITADTCSLEFYKDRPEADPEENPTDSPAGNLPAVITTNCADLDPLYLNIAGADSLLGTPDDDLRPAATSLTIDAGENAFILAPNPPPGIPSITRSLDFARLRRVLDGTGDALATVDLGCHESPIQIPPPLFADLNNDNLVDGADLGLLLSAWNSHDEAADLNDDGAVNGADLGLLLGAWSA